MSDARRSRSMICVTRGADHAEANVVGNQPDRAVAQDAAYLLTYFGLSASSRDRLQDLVSLSRIAFATPIMDLPVFVSPVATDDTDITGCATLTRFSQPISASRHDRVTAYHALAVRHSRTGADRWDFARRARHG